MRARFAYRLPRFFFFVFLEALRLRALRYFHTGGSSSSFLSLERSAVMRLPVRVSVLVRACGASGLVSGDLEISHTSDPTANSDWTRVASNSNGVHSGRFPRMSHRFCRRLCRVSTLSARYRETVC